MYASQVFPLTQIAVCEARRNTGALTSTTCIAPLPHRCQLAEHSPQLRESSLSLQAHAMSGGQPVAYLGAAFNFVVAVVE